MQPRINVITLGVKNIERSRHFYERELGWKASSVSSEHFVVFKMNGLALCLYPEASLAEDAMVEICQQGFRGVTLAHNVISKDEVDGILRLAVNGGAVLVKHAQDTFWGGYSGYFSDPDGHLWEIAWNPHWPIKNDGILEVPE